MDALLKNSEFMQKLQQLPEKLHADYINAKPYPHIVIDNFLPEAVLDDVLNNYPKPDQLRWQTFDNENEKKLAFRQAESLPTCIRELLYFMNSHPLLQFLERLTGINALIPDPSFTGGGCHQIVPGGKLQVHVDFNKLMPHNLDRRLNLLIYLNKDWREEYGGKFELWDAEGKASIKQVLPIFNRCVVFSTTQTSYHGHPHPLSCPADRTRKSIALYYYTNGRDDEHIAAPHSTKFLGGDAEYQESWPKALVRNILPPFLYTAGKKIKSAFGS